MFILLAITISSCYSTDTEPTESDLLPEDSFWEHLSGLPLCPFAIAVANNGDI